MTTDWNAFVLSANEQAPTPAQSTTVTNMTEPTFGLLDRGAHRFEDVNPRVPITRDALDVKCREAKAFEQQWRDSGKPGRPIQGSALYIIQQTAALKGVATIAPLTLRESTQKEAMDAWIGLVGNNGPKLYDVAKLVTWFQAPLETMLRLTGSSSTAMLNTIRTSSAHGDMMPGNNTPSQCTPSSPAVVPPPPNSNVRLMQRHAHAMQDAYATNDQDLAPSDSNQHHEQQHDRAMRNIYAADKQSALVSKQKPLEAMDNKADGYSTDEDEPYLVSAARRRCFAKSCMDDDDDLDMKPRHPEPLCRGRLQSTPSPPSDTNKRSLQQRTNAMLNMRGADKQDTRSSKPPLSKPMDSITPSHSTDEDSTPPPANKRQVQQRTYATRDIHTIDKQPHFPAPQRRNLRPNAPSARQDPPNDAIVLDSDPESSTTVTNMTEPTFGLLDRGAHRFEDVNPRVPITRDALDVKCREAKAFEQQWRDSGKPGRPIQGSALYIIQQTAALKGVATIAPLTLRESTQKEAMDAWIGLVGNNGPKLYDVAKLVTWFQAPLETMLRLTGSSSTAMLNTIRTSSAHGDMMPGNNTPSQCTPSSPAVVPPPPNSNVRLMQRHAHAMQDAYATNDQDLAPSDSNQHHEQQHDRAMRNIYAADKQSALVSKQKPLEAMDNKADGYSTDEDEPYLVSAARRRCFAKSCMDDDNDLDMKDTRYSKPPQGKPMDSITVSHSTDELYAVCKHEGILPSM
ncbi:hypothetical protein V8C86DRAFT_2443782 [Haematococcus lacustris]